MKNHLYRFLSLILVLLLLFTGCQAPSASTDKSVNVSQSSINYEIGLAEGDNEEFNTFLMDCFAELVTSDSITFHYTLQNPENYGVSMDAVTLGDADLITLEDNYDQTKAYLATLESFNYDQLSSRQQLVYDIFKNSLELSIESYDYRLYGVLFSPTTGIQAQLPIILNEYIFYSEDDVADYFLLLKDIPNYFRDLLDIERFRSEQGLFMSDTTADAIIKQCEAFIENPEENLLIDIFDDKLDAELPDLKDQKKSDYIHENKTIVLENVIPAYQMIIDELTALKGTGVNDLGLAYFEQGKEYYEYLAKEATGSSKTVKEMIKLTEETIVENITLVTLLVSMDNSLYDRMYEFNPELAEPSEILKQLQISILSDFPTPVSTNFSVKYVHESLEKDLSPAFYMIPAIDAVDANTIYINNYQNDGTDNVTFFSTLAHEGYPGHLYQQTMFNSTNPHPIYGILDYTGYAEGWATYVEQQSYAWIGADEDLSRILKANQNFALGISARVDLGVNYEGWDRADTADYLSNFGISDEATVNDIFDYVVAEPATYLSYYIGAQEFWNLRQIAEENLGDQFDPVAYHEFILTLGPATFDLIQEKLEIWIQNQLS